MVGRVIEVNNENSLVIEVRNAFNLGDEIEILPFNSPAVTFKVQSIHSLSGVEYERSRPSTLVKIKSAINISCEANSIIRMKK